MSQNGETAEFDKAQPQDTSVVTESVNRLDGQPTESRRPFSMAKTSGTGSARITPGKIGGRSVLPLGSDDAGPCARPPLMAGWPSIQCPVRRLAQRIWFRQSRQG